MLPARIMDRRGVLTMTAVTAAGLALPSRHVLAETDSGHVINALADYMDAAGARALPPDVAEHAKHHLLDTLASMISGSELLPGQSAQRYIRAHGGRGRATVVGTSLTAGPADAALANGVMAHADETDDSHNASRSHPGCAVVPAALAVGEELGIDGARFLRAVTLGYDLGPRVVMAMGGADWSYETSLATQVLRGHSAPQPQRRAPRDSTHARCDGRWTTPPSSLRASWLGGAIPIISKRRSFSLE
jgi:hypothetical protein